MQPLSRWNSYTKTMGINLANVVSWDDLKQLKIREYCPREGMQKMEKELWNLMMQKADISTYTSRFNDLATFCPGMVTPEEKKIESYIWGLPQPSHGLVTA